MSLLAPLLPLLFATNPVLAASPSPVESSAPSADAPADASTRASTAEVADSETDRPPRDPGRSGRPDIVAPTPDADAVRRINGYARGVGIGFQQGVWGKGFGQSLHLDLPFGRRVGQFFGLRLAGTFVHGQVEGRYDPVGFGHVELFGRSPVIGGIVRAYGGGGIRAGGRVHPDLSGRRYGFTGGGHFGLEVFAAPRVSFNVEVGVQGPVHSKGLDTGGNAMAGVTIWLGDLGRKR